MLKPIARVSISVAVALMLSARVTAAQSTLSPIARAAVDEAWKMVPALSTHCFSADPFEEKLREVSNAIRAARERQEAINEPVLTRFHKMDMGEKMQRMQSFMMKNPEAAMKMMTSLQAMGATANAEMPEANEAATRLDTELEDLKARFKKALEEAAKPALAKQRQWVATKTVAVGEVGAPMFTNAADHAHYGQLVAEENAAVEKACATYFGAGGSMHQWIGRYRTEVTDKVIATGVANEDGILTQLQAMQLPAEGVRPTEALRLVEQFLQKVSSVYGARPAKSEPRIGIN